MTIDWVRIYGARADKPQFSDEQIAAACAAANALPGKGKGGDKLKSPWDQPKKMPGIDDVDFRDISVKKLPIDSLMASDNGISRARLLWHIKNPGQTKNPSVFTGNPMVLDHKQGQVIIDGHHRLYAMKLLGQTSYPCWLLPSN